MAETLPRWGLQPVEFVETDPSKIQSEIITKYEEVAQRTLAAGDPVRLFLLTLADRIIHLQNCINIAGQQNLLSYAQKENLDALGNNLSVERLTDSHAVTTFRATLVQALGDDYTIPANFEITNGVVTFATDKELVIPAGNMTGDVSATCTTAGVAGNDYLAGQISTIVKPLTFLSSMKNITITSGGADAETDPEYAERIRLAPNSFSVAGPTKAYEFHAYSVSSAIIDVSVTSPNPGEVKVYPLLENGTLPSAEVLDQIEAYLSSDDIRPLTDEVEALSPTAHNYEINVDFWINKEDVSKSEAIRAAVEEAVEQYRVWQQAKIGRDITPDQLICNVKAAGASRVDFSTLSPASWVKLDAHEVAQCTNVTVTYKGTKDE
jgi:phage-related baseplate assembly protein